MTCKHRQEGSSSLPPFDPNPGPSGCNNAPSVMNGAGGSGINNMLNIEYNASANARSNENVDMSVQEMHVRQTNNFVLSDVILPKFGNRQHENPLQYLKDLQNFFDLRAVPEQSKLLVVKNSLIGNCSSWFEMYIDMSMCYEEFKRAFMDQYWDIRKQNEVKNKIVNGMYNVKRDGNMCDYFLKMGQLAKFVDPPISPQELISLVANHFPTEARSAIIISKPKTFKETMQLLKELQVGISQTPFRENDRRADENHMWKREVNALTYGKRARSPDNQNVSRMIQDRNGGRPSESNQRGRWVPERGRRNSPRENNHQVNRLQLLDEDSEDDYRTPFWMRRDHYPRRHRRPRNYDRRYFPRSNQGSYNRRLTNHGPDVSNPRNHELPEVPPSDEDQRDNPVERLLDSQNSRRTQQVRSDVPREDLN